MINGVIVSGNGEAGLDLGGDLKSNAAIEVLNSCIIGNGFPRSGFMDGEGSGPVDNPQGGIRLNDIDGSVTIGGSVEQVALGSNIIEGNAPWGVKIDDSDADDVDATLNWWAAANGPAPAGSGNSVVNGDIVTILFEPFLTARPNLPCDVSQPTPSSAPASVTVTVTKAVVGDAPEGASYAFELDCIGFDDSFSLAAGESRTTASFAANTLCSLTETDNGGAESVSGEFSGVLIDGSRSVTVTNTFPVIPEVLGTAISKTLVGGGTAAVGETVRFDIGVTFTGGPLRNVELVDVFEHDVLGFEGVYVGSTALDCQVFAGIPDAAHSTVACDLGDASGPFTVQAMFTALAGTLPGSSVNQASVINDQDGAGGDPPTTTGPVSADVEIVEVLALPPLGDGDVRSGGAAAASMLLAALAALDIVAGGRRLTGLAAAQR